MGSDCASVMQPADVAALIDSHAHTATTAQDELAAAVQRLRDLADDVDGGQAGVGAIGDPIGQLRKRSPGTTARRLRSCLLICLAIVWRRCLNREPMQSGRRCNH